MQTPLLFDLQHNPEWIGRASLATMPALLRSSLVWNAMRRRPVLPLEGFLVNGWGVYASDPCVPLEYLRSLSTSDLRELSGNQMNMPLLGSLFTYIALDHMPL